MSELVKNDYEEPRCLLNMHPEVVRIPTGRVIEKLDAYLAKKDYDAAERHLRYWEREAAAGNDERGRLTVLNEEIGLYRKTEKEEECLRAISEALALAEAAEMEGTITYGTTLLNAATGYKAFGKAGEALVLYRKARTIYEAALSPEDARLGGLYNNMALALTACGDHGEARELYEKALAIMSKQENGALEVAITYLNMADLAAAEKGMEAAEETIGMYLEKAEALMDDASLPRDGYYAFVCEKCAPVFGYYGYFLAEKELMKRAEEIYERT